MTQDIARYFEPLEKAIRQKFLPALLDVPTDFIGGEFRELLGHSVRTGGIGVRNPVTTAGAAFRTSREASRLLVDSLLGKCDFRCWRHAAQVRQVAQHAKDIRLADEEAYSAELQGKKLRFAIRTDRAAKAGT